MPRARSSVVDPRRFLREDLRGERATYTRPHEASDRPRARLHMNEAPADWPRAAKQAWLERLATTDLHVYPETEHALAARLARRLGAPEGGVILGSSSGALLDLLATAGVGPKDLVAFPSPGFSLYPMLVKRHGGVPLEIPVGRALPLEGFAEAARDPRVKQLWVTVPNNPTGAYATPEEVTRLLDQVALLPEPPLVVLDEAYAEFSPRTLRLLPDRYPFVVLLRTFSKALASAGLRLGALVGAPELLAELSALKLPYSISTPQLVALEVALDHAASFDLAVREVQERRDRLVTSLVSAGVDVTPTASNFLHLAEDVMPALEKVDVLARRLPPGRGTRISMGSEETTAKVAAALGAELPSPRPWPRVPLLVLDVDGVMIDAESSFREAVRLALREMRPELPWENDLFRLMKRLGGMNNDFRLTAGLVALFDRGELAQLWEGKLAWNDEREAALQVHLDETSRRVGAHYDLTRKNETALVDEAELRALGVSLAVLTGRAPHELVWAFETLGFSCEAVSDSAPHLRKPEPAGLLQLADAFRATDVVFVGDTRDDRTACHAAAALRPETRFVFAGVGPDHGSFVDEASGDLRAETLRDLLALPELARALVREGATRPTTASNRTRTP